ncbi:MAG: beta-Ig-H3/fasciclin [Calothrix sp. C42_A2020_038]|nr:beta-Ig-H3/fasciclin [Calothrix sp. C42_A2020_038]
MNRKLVFLIPVLGLSLLTGACETGNEPGATPAPEATPPTTVPPAGTTPPPTTP